MDINDILSSLGIDLTNPEAKRGAIEAIQAILDSRTPPPDMSGGGGGMGSSEKEVDVEIDPDLIQPSQKFNLPNSDDDIEIEDEEDILSQVKHNDSEDELNNDGNTSGDDSSENDSDDNSASEDSSDSDGDSDDGIGDGESTDEGDDTEGSDELTSSSEATDEEDDELENSNDDQEDVVDENDFDQNGSDYEEDESSENDEDESEDDGTEESEDSEEETDSAEDTEDESDFDEDDFLDDEIKNTYDDQSIKSKHEARRIKRERTLAAAKAALEKAQAKNVSQSLIKELEKSIEALESLTEAKAKSLADISDEEFNLLINRVFDAISAVGNNELTFTSDEEREMRAQEIKTDLNSRETQQELSDEDIAAIRAETQAIKAREKETAIYRTPAASSFKGFQEFLNSLYRAIALQVQTNEVQDDTWSAINRRYSGTGVLKQGQRKNDLPDKKIPVIDFYFDCSSSWGADDIKVGKKAVQALADMEEKGQIKINLYYFGDEVSANYSDVAGQGTSGWNEIVKNIIATQATNVIIMTDSDMENWWVGETALKYKVPGYVWYLWKNGRNAPRLPRDLNGRGGVQQFSFNRGDV